MSGSIASITTARQSHAGAICATCGALLLAACADTGDSSDRQIPDDYRPREIAELDHERGSKDVRITSEPSGAQIQVDQQSVGETPCTLRVTTNGHDKLIADHEIIAFPTEPNQYTKFTWLLSGKEPPSRVFFDMRLRESKTSPDDPIAR